MIKTILKNTYLYKRYRAYKAEKRERRKNALNEAFKTEAVDVLRLFSDALLSNGLVFWLDYGTLLGYYREHDFIPHDYDLDTGAWFKDHERIRKALEAAGFELVRYYYLRDKDGMEECYKHKKYRTTIDVLYFMTEGDKSFCYSFLPMVAMNKKKNLNKLQPSRARLWTFSIIQPVLSEFKGVKVYVPDNTAQHLASTYGDSFMTPIPDFPVVGRPNMKEFSYEELPACAFLKVGYV